MKFKNVDTLYSAVDAICELKNISIGVVPNHALYLPKNLLEAIHTQENKKEFSVRVVNLGFRNAKVGVLYHGHEIETGLDWDEIPLVSVVESED